MIIAFCLFKFFPYGGLSRDFLRIAKELRDRGHIIRVYVQKWDGDPIAGIEVIKLPCTRLTNHGRIKEYYKNLRLFLERSPVDIIFGFNKMPGLDYYFVADVCYEAKVSREKKGLAKFFYKLTSRYRTFSKYEQSVFGSKSQTHILFIHESQKNDYKYCFNIPCYRYNILSPGLNNSCRYDNYSEEEKLSFRKLIGAKSDNSLLIQVGSDFRRKGLDRTLIAISSLPSAILKKTKLLLIGKDDISAYKRLIRKLGLTDNLIFLNGLDSAELAISASDILLHPAYVENTGTVILESIALQTPVIVTENCGYAQHVKDSRSGIVLNSPFYQDEYNAALLRLLTDRSFYASCKVNAKTYTDKRDLYNMPIEIANLIEFYHNG